jgi:hypothetical protein
VASDEHIEACILYMKDGEVLSLRTFVEDGGARLHELLSRLRAQGMSMVRLPKVHPAEDVERIARDARLLLRRRASTLCRDRWTALGGVAIPISDTSGFTNVSD